MVQHQDHVIFYLETGGLIYCFSTEQIAFKKDVFIRVVNPQAIKCQHNDRFSYSDKTKSNQSEPIRSLSTQLPPVPSNTIVPSFSITDLMKAKKLVKPPEEQEETLMLQSYSTDGKTWERMQPVKFLVEKEKFAEGGFWEAFKTTCVNSSNTRNIKNLSGRSHEKTGADACSGTPFSCKV